MQRSIRSKPTDAELEILNILWTVGPATVRRVHDDLSRTKPSQYTTTLKILLIMADKGLVDRDERARSHVYRPTIERAHAQRQMAAHLMERAFGGSLRSLVIGALGGRRATRNELTELRELIQEHEKDAPGEKLRKGRPR